MIIKNTLTTYLNKIYTSPIIINNIDAHKKINSTNKNTHIAIIGGGLAGLVATTYLAKRNIPVTLYEKEDTLGGKCRSQKEIIDEKEIWADHGFHGIFKQYFNLRALLKLIGADKSLKTISDYSILRKNNSPYSFTSLSPIPILNILGLRRLGTFAFKDLLLHPRFWRMINLLAYHPEKTRKKYQAMSFEDLIHHFHIPKSLSTILIVFARAFFSAPQDIRADEVIRCFHFYFLGHTRGLLYDYPTIPYENWLIDPLRRIWENMPVTLKMNHCVQSIDENNNMIEIDGTSKYTHIIIATNTVGHLNISKLSPFINKIAPEIKHQKTSVGYAVWRIYLRNTNYTWPYPDFVATENNNILDSIVAMHKYDKFSEQWAKKYNGSVYELHSYCLPNDGKISEHDVRQNFIDDFKIFCPEITINSHTLVTESLNIGRDFSSWPKETPQIPVHTNSKQVFFAGDSIKTNTPATLMEAATTSALQAVNHILRDQELQEEPILSIRQTGIFASTYSPWKH